MVAIVRPIITLKEGESVKNIEGILRKYDFEKREGIVGPEYYLFKKEDSSLVSVNGFFDRKGNEYTGVAIVSYEGERNRELLIQLQERLGIQLKELRRIKDQSLIHDLKRFYGDRFLELVIRVHC